MKKPIILKGSILIDVVDKMEYFSCKELVDKNLVEIMIDESLLVFLKRGVSIEDVIIERNDFNNPQLKITFSDKEIPAFILKSGSDNTDSFIFEVMQEICLMADENY